MAAFTPDHFRAIEDPDRARELFRISVERVEIETHSYCNRRCGYCPNVIGDRLGPNVRMPDALFNRIADDLGTIGYAGAIVLNNYNEPLYDRGIIARIAALSAKAPRAHTQIYSNGDYLDAAYLDELAAAGLKELHVSIHMDNAQTYSDTYALNRIQEVAQRIARKPKFTAMRSGEFIAAEFPGAGSIRVHTRAINYWQHGQNRGGLIEGIKSHVRRTAPCHFPFAHFYVGYTGNIVPCCHIRSDREEHAQFRTGNVADYETIFLAYASAAAAGWRRHLATFAEKKGPCLTCDAPFLNGSAAALEAYRKHYDAKLAPALPALPA